MKDAGGERLRAGTLRLWEGECAAEGVRRESEDGGCACVEREGGIVLEINTH